MKTLILLLLAPTLVLTQMNEKMIPNEIDVQFWLDIPTTQFPENMAGTIELSITLEVAVNDYSPNYELHKTKFEHIPQHFTTFSLSKWHPSEKEVTMPNDKLEKLIAMNNTMFPKENTFNKSFSPVRQEDFKFQNPQNIPLGFGPKIIL